MDIDWAYLEKFKIENRILKNQFDDNRVVFIGDSIIAGWEKHSIFIDNQHFINRGINGQTTSQILHRIQQDVIDLKPKSVVILVGTNDIAENLGPISLQQIKANFLSILEITEANNIKLILCSILPVSAYYWNPTILPEDKIKTLNAFLASLAHDRLVFYVNFYIALEDEEKFNVKFSEDGVHPNLDGYTVMSDILLKSNYL